MCRIVDTVEPQNKGLITSASFVLCKEVAPPLGGSKCSATIGNICLGPQAVSFVERLSFVWNAHYRRFCCTPFFVTYGMYIICMYVAIYVGSSFTYFLRNLDVSVCVTIQHQHASTRTYGTSYVPTVDCGLLQLFDLRQVKG